MTEVFRFFGFGENFIKILNTIGTNRSAAIIFEDGSLSKNFSLETGRTQGDGPSPLLYNMGEQILLLKIELDPSVASVYQHQNFPHFAMDLVPDQKLKGKDLMYSTIRTSKLNPGGAPTRRTASQTTTPPRQSPLWNP
jgi:hypothetical protein